ncbi:hypothetical protein [Nocardia wallacei]|uniref:hypothetical protein n=1 Tax=Nocardia wallacei TaxID=480035 RepID=UPI002453D7C3|nr:hypothetical protein [Nocardia wallacei]
MLVTSRSAAEYRAMFDLPARLPPAHRVLDCCAGGSSFAAESGGDVVAVDPVYGGDRQDLAARVRTGIEDGDRIIAAHAARFDWQWYGDPARRARLRRAAGERFLTDLREHPDRYVAGALPDLPFGNGRFDLTLCSHLLFTWSDRFDEHWHRAALAELARVTRGEIRVFPLVVQGSGDPVPFLDTLLGELREAGHRVTRQGVPYRFQRGADEMVRIEVRRPLSRRRS